MNKWSVEQLPELLPADIVLTRNDAWTGKTIRWLLYPRNCAVPEADRYNHGLLVGWPVRSGQIHPDWQEQHRREGSDWAACPFCKDIEDYAILESLAKGVSPGGLSQYQGEAICILRYPGLTLTERKAIVTTALLDYGRYGYDWDIVLDIIFAKGLGTFVGILDQRFIHQQVLELPEVLGDDVICTALLQRSFADNNWPLKVDGKVLLPYKGSSTVLELVWRS